MGIAERWKRFKELPQDVSERVKALGPVFRENGVTLAYLFGSLAAGRSANDVDLAVVWPSGDVLKLRATIAEALGTERVDIIDLTTAPPVWKFEIVRTGDVIYSVSDEVENRFELDTIHLYRDTAPLRKRLREHLRDKFGRG